MLYLFSFMVVISSCAHMFSSGLRCTSNCQKTTTWKHLLNPLVISVWTFLCYFIVWVKYLTQTLTYKVLRSTFLLFCLLYCGAFVSVDPEAWPFKRKLLISTFLWCCLLCCTKCYSFHWVCEWNPKQRIPFKWNLHWPVLSCGAVYYAVQSVIALSLWMKS